MKRLMTVIAAAAIACSCSPKNEVAEIRGIRTGDLVFAGLPYSYTLGEDSGAGEGSISEAIAAATANDSINFIHTAIAEVASDTLWIIDATIAHGVDRHPWDVFISDFTLRDGSEPIIRVRRLADTTGICSFVEAAKQFVGRPYDLSFREGNDAYYCTELVRASYITPDGKHLFEAVAMNFNGPDGELPLYWRQLFERLGEPVPNGEPGTNPNQMYTSPLLVPVTF